MASLKPYLMSQNVIHLSLTSNINCSQCVESANLFSKNLHEKMCTSMMYITWLMAWNYFFSLSQRCQILITIANDTCCQHPFQTCLACAWKQISNEVFEMILFLFPQRKLPKNTKILRMPRYIDFYYLTSTTQQNTIWLQI